MCNTRSERRGRQKYEVDREVGEVRDEEEAELVTMFFTIRPPIKIHM